jgi:hypothetical protein
MARFSFSRPVQPIGQTGAKGFRSILGKIASVLTGRRKKPAAKPWKAPSWETGEETPAPPSPPVTPEPTRLGDEGRQFHGHHGYALGSTEEGKMDISPENKAKWRGLTQTEAANFFYNAVPLYVHSTNVVSAQYRRKEHTMVVVFGKGKNAKGAGYRYHNVTDAMAQEFLEAGSKGSFIWDVFRVRGSKTAHKVPYDRLF